MPDFSAWIQGCSNFLARLGTAPGHWTSRFSSKPPLLKRQADEIDRTLRHRMPSSVREFVLTACGGCRLHYVWETEDDAARQSLNQICEGETTVYGRADLLDVSKFVEWQEDCAGMLDLAIGDFPEEAGFWNSAFPVARMDNGDFLGLDLRKGTEDPPVVYLSHDSESRRIANSLAEFLTCWEGLRYIGPESWMLKPFCDRRSGLLRSDTRRAGQLRRLLDGAAGGRDSPLPWPPAMEVGEFINQLEARLRHYGTLHGEGSGRADFAAGHASERTAYIEPIQPNIRFAGNALALIRDLQQLLARFPRWTVRFPAVELRDGSEGGEFTVRGDGIEPPILQGGLESFLTENAKLRLHLFRWRKGLRERRFRTIRDGIRRAFRRSQNVSVVAWFDDRRGNIWLDHEGRPGASIWVLFPVTAAEGPGFEDSLRAGSGFDPYLKWATRSGRIVSDPPRRLSPQTARALIEFEDRSAIRKKLRFWVGRKRYDFERPPSD
jgi:hypothetical protein